jgi:hypothetical protein
MPLSWIFIGNKLEFGESLLGANRSGLYYEPLGESEENLQLMRLLDE